MAGLTVVLTSFRKSRNNGFDDAWKWSGAVYQPSGFFYKKAEWCDIRNNGKWTRPRDFLDSDDPLSAYKDSLLSLYGGRQADMLKWIEELHDLTIWLCCWCPYDKAAQRQLKEHGSFVCHTEILRQVLEPFVRVYLDEDRQKLMKRL